MRETALGERLRWAGLVITAALRSTRTGLAGRLPSVGVFGARAPRQLLIAPQDIRTSDPTVATDVYGGHFAFAGRIVETQGQSPFTKAPPSPAWARELTSFAWLRHLRAADSALSRANARALVGDWIEVSKERRGPAWEPDVVARRLMSWLSQSPIILDGADWAFYRRFMKSIGQQAGFLESRLRGGLQGEARLTVTIALAATGLCAEGLSGLQKRSTRYLQAELKRQILADGGHASRNPRPLISLLLDMLPLRQAYAARGVQAPAELLNAVDRMMPMLRLFRHADGAMALFNGMGVTAPESLATLLAYDDARAGAMHNAPHSGYQRLDAGASSAIVDVGAPPEREFAAEAHAGCLAFEFSTGSQRIVVNCGAPGPTSRAELRDATRATAAHSTLVVEESSSCRFAPPRLRSLMQSPILSGPTDVRVERIEAETGPLIRASHDGYVGRFGVYHDRQLWLSADGNRLSGEDTLRSASPQSESPALAYAVRFHLHPAAQPQRLADGRMVEITLPGGETWLFEATDATVDIEDSVFFAAPDGAHRTHQLVMRTTLDATARVSWSLERR